MLQLNLMIQKKTTSKHNNADTNKSNIKNTSSNTTSTKSKKYLAKEISQKEGGSFKFIEPISLKKSGNSYKATKSNGSNLFYCSDTPLNSSNLNDCELVELIDNGNSSYRFTVKDFNALKNGGSGSIANGTISTNGVIK